MSSEVFETEKTIKSWDEDYYHPIAETYYDSAIQTMLQLMDVQPESTILDAGCGPGVHSIRVAKKNHKIRAIDISETMLNEAARRVEKANLKALVEFQKEDLTNLKIPDASFQYVFSWGVVIHIKHIEKALNELARVVKPKGKLALYVTNKMALDHLLELPIRFIVGKPKVKQQKLAMGNGTYYDMNGNKLWVWEIDVNYLSEYVESLGFRLVHRVIGEFTEIQRRLEGKPREFLLRLNNLCYFLKLPPTLASTNLLVFEKIS